MNIGLQKTSLVNFPGRVASAVFLPGCNLRCPFCHNGELATASVVSGPRSLKDEQSEYFSIEDIYAHLEKRAGVLTGLAISGGEPLLSPALHGLILKAKSLGLAVKIDTNGTVCDRLQTILDDNTLRPDMIALDVKTSPSRYGELTIEKSGNNFAGEALLRTLAILEQHARHGSLRIEYRTVLVPSLVGEAEIHEIGSLLPKNADWQLASFVPGTCLDSEWNKVAPYGPVETQRLLALAKSHVSEAQLR